MCSNAAYGGHMDLLRWLVAQGCPYEVWVDAFLAMVDSTCIVGEPVD